MEDGVCFITVSGFEGGGKKKKGVVRRSMRYDLFNI